MPIALATLRLIREARFMNGLILGRQWSLLAPTPGLGRVERRLAARTKIDRAPQSREIRIFRLVEGLSRCERGQQRRKRADRTSQWHGRPPYELVAKASH